MMSFAMINYPMESSLRNLMLNEIEAVVVRIDVVGNSLL